MRTASWVAPIAYEGRLVHWGRAANLGGREDLDGGNTIKWQVTGQRLTEGDAIYNFKSATDLRSGGSARRPTFGGIKVERPRRQMKLMAKISCIFNCYYKVLVWLNAGVLFASSMKLLWLMDSTEYSGKYDSFSRKWGSNKPLVRAITWGCILIICALAISHNIRKSLLKIMALFRPVSTGRLITYLAPASQRLSSQQIRWTSQTNGEASAEPASKTSSSDYATPKAPDTSLIRQDDASEGVADHQLNYHAPIDHGTSWEPRNLLASPTDAFAQTLLPSSEAGHGWERGRKFSSCCSAFRCPSWPPSTDSSVKYCSSLKLHDSD